MRILRLIDRNQLIAEVDIPQYIKDVINSSFTEDQIES
jgi:glutathionylspermidine synthase